MRNTEGLIVSRFGVAAAVTALFCFLAAGPVRADTLRGGAARALFDLPDLVPLAGYSRRHGEPSEGILDPVGVTALALEQDSRLVFIVSADLLIIDEFLYRSVRAGLERAFPDRPFTLFLAATHTHSGPGAYGRRFAEKLSMGHYDPVVFQAISDRIVAVTRRAAESMAPVGVGYGEAAYPEGIRNRVVESGPTDALLRWVRLTSEKPILLVSYSAHPTILGADNRRLSADYPGVLERELTGIGPGGVLFLAGTVGDQGPVSSGGGPRAEVDALGEALVRVVTQRASAEHADDGVSMRAAVKQIALPDARVRLGRWRLPGWLGRRLVDDDATLSVVRLGRVLLLGTPCDMTTALGDRLREKALARGYQPIVVSFVNDYVGYCVPKEIYLEDEYEARMAFNGPDAGEIVVDELVRMMDALE